MKIKKVDVMKRLRAKVNAADDVDELQDALEKVSRWLDDKELADENDEKEDEE